MPSRPEFDAIVVLGAALWCGGRPSPALVRRVEHAVALLKAGRARRLVMSGGVGRHPPAEALVMRDLALAAGVRRSAVLTERFSRDTLGNGRHCAGILRRAGWRSVLLVTDRFHLPRALLVFRALGLTVTGSAPCGVRQALGNGRWLYYCLREAAALPWTLVRLPLAVLRQRWRQAP